MSIEKDGTKLTSDKLKEIAQKYGINVTDAAERGIRVIGILGGISAKHHRTGKRVRVAQTTTNGKTGHNKDERDT